CSGRPPTSTRWFTSSSLQTRRTPAGHPREPDMLPSRLLDCELTPDGRVLPKWLGARDEPWLRELAAEAMAAAGRAVGEVAQGIVDVVAPVARRHAVGRRAVEAVWTIERRRWSTLVRSPVPPRILRRTVFELAAERSREEALATAAATLGVEGLDAT